jgi:xanthine dehydrogenase/oxidase
VGTDLIGRAVFDACTQLKQRLKSFREKNPNGCLKDWAIDAYTSGVSLSAIGFYFNSDLNYDPATNTGKLSSYKVNGVSVSEVELDLLTGEHCILQTDILMDIGNSLNYSIDIGQIEGAFMQGVGLFTLEELFHSRSNGKLLTQGALSYRAPRVDDIPRQLNIRILNDKEYTNLPTIKSSKGVGEPPLLMAMSVFFALREAVKNAR